jgi:hypothetical protein
VVPSSRLAGALAAVMIMIALYCAGRLAISALRRRETEVDADVVHMVMGVAMAGMFLPWLSPLPGGVWEAMFAAGGAWFGWQAVGGRRGAGQGRWSRHPVPHLVECVAMCYMLLALSGPRPSGPARGMIMPAMGGSSWNLPALALVLALFMVGYVIWVADQLASAARGRSVLAVADPAYDPARGRATRPALAPRLAACYKIAMSMTMGYMLILMI